MNTFSCEPRNFERKEENYKNDFSLFDRKKLGCVQSVHEKELFSLTSMNRYNDK